MRLTIGRAAMASLCLLAGCNNGVANNSANAPAPAVNVAEPMPVTPPAETPAPGNVAGGAEVRASAIAQCVSGSPGHLPAGTDANAFCSCAVDRMIAGNTPQSEALNQCAAEMHIALTNPEQ